MRIEIRLLVFFAKWLDNVQTEQAMLCLQSNAIAFIYIYNTQIVMSPLTCCIAPPIKYWKMWGHAQQQQREHV